MKTKLLLNFLLFTFSFLLCPAQTPQGFNYQAIARDGSGNPIVGATIKVKLSILTDTAGFRATGGGVYLWEEEHLNVLTNAFGLFTIVLGDPLATKVGGSAASFSVINWSLPDLYIGTKIANPTTYKFLGAAKLWSVPYALRAKDSDQWQVNGANIYRPAGNFGIGTNSPVALLDIKTSSNFHFGAFYNTAGAASIGAFNDGFSLWQPLSINPGGQVWFLGGLIGIGTTSPTRKVEMGGTSSSFYLNSATSNLIEYNMQGVAPPSFTTRSAGTKIALYPGVSATTAEYALGIDASTLWMSVPNNTGNYKFFAGTSEIMRIMGTGNVGIGTVSPTAKLEVRGTTRGVTTNGALAHSAQFQAMTDNSGQGLRAVYSFYPTFESTPTDNVGRRAADIVGGYNGGAWGYEYLSFNVGYNNLANDGGNLTSEKMRITSGGLVGIGTTTPTSKMTIRPPADWDDNVPLFEVKNKWGTSVLAVYNNGVRILVGHDPVKGITKGGFAIGGFDNTKAVGETVNLMTVAPDSIRFNIDNDNTKGITKGGFAIGSFDVTKGINVNPKEFMNMTPLGSPIGKYNTFIGYQSGLKNQSTGWYNSFIGYKAGTSNTTGDNNVYIGYGAGLSNQLGVDNVIIGKNAGPAGTNMSYSTFVGAGAGLRTTVDQNTFIGCYAGNQNTTGVDNTYIGTFAGFVSATDYQNTYLGRSAGEGALGSSNILIGYQAGIHLTGNNNIIIGNNVDPSPTSNTLLIGPIVTNIPFICGNMSAYMLGVGRVPTAVTFEVGGNASKATAGSWIANSDFRIKRNIEDIDDALGLIQQLRPVKFRYSDEWLQRNPVIKDKEYYNFVAQEYQKVFPESVTGSGEYLKGQPDEILQMDSYNSQIIAVKAIQELIRQNNEQQKQIESTKEENQQLKSQLQTLQEKMEKIEAMLLKGGVR